MSEMHKRTILVAIGLVLIPAAAQAQSDAAESLAILKALGLDEKSDEEIAAIAEEAAKYPLGSMENPVRADGPRGQRAYLSRLRCPDGSRPDFERSGSLGPGPYDSIVDLYKVECEDGTETAVIMDMYHPDYVEAEPVANFTIRAP